MLWANMLLPNSSTWLPYASKGKTHIYLTLKYTCLAQKQEDNIFLHLSFLHDSATRVLLLPLLHTGCLHSRGLMDSQQQSAGKEIFSANSLRTFRQTRAQVQNHSSHAFHWHQEHLVTLDVFPEEKAREEEIKDHKKTCESTGSRGLCT